MAKYFCEYCGIRLTQASPNGRKQHMKGKKHKQIKVEYYRTLIQKMQLQTPRQLALLKHSAQFAQTFAPIFAVPPPMVPYM